MVLFVLYIEPLLKMLNEVVTGEQLGQRVIKSLAYADDICFLSKNDVESDLSFSAIQNFCDESGACLNSAKSAFIRFNDC
jgi:Reverse transcriptase (RNA-dependent DNA polymerase)